MCVSSNSNIAFHCKICNISIKDEDSAVRYDICQLWIRIKCNKLNYIDYEYLHGSNDLWYSITCCGKAFPLETLTNKHLSLANSLSPSFTKNSDTYISKNKPVLVDTR